MPPVAIVQGNQLSFCKRSSPVLTLKEVVFSGYQILSTPQHVLDISNVDEETRIYMRNNEGTDDTTTAALETGFSNYKSLQALKKDEINKPNPNLVFVVISCDDIYEDLLSYYRKRSTVFHSLFLTFSSENTGGDGIRRN